MVYNIAKKRERVIKMWLYCPFCGTKTTSKQNIAEREMLGFCSKHGLFVVKLLKGNRNIAYRAWKDGLTDSLTELQKLTCRLIIDEGKSVSEVARMRGINPSAVYTCFNMALNKLTKAK